MIHSRETPRGAPGSCLHSGGLRVPTRFPATEVQGSVSPAAITLLSHLPLPWAPLSSSASQPSQAHSGGALNDTHWVPGGSLGTREAPASRWPFLPKGSQWSQVPLEECRRGRSDSREEGVSPQSVSLGPLPHGVDSQPGGAVGMLRDLWGHLMRSPAGQGLTLAPSLPSRPGRPCSPGDPGGPGGPLSPRGPASPVFPWRGRRRILNGGGLGWGSA